MDTAETALLPRLARRGITVGAFRQISDAGMRHEDDRGNGFGSEERLGPDGTLTIKALPDATVSVAGLPS